MLFPNDTIDPERVSQEIEQQSEKYPDLKDSEISTRSFTENILFDLKQISAPYWVDVYRMCLLSTIIAFIFGLFIWGIDLGIHFLIRSILYGESFSFKLTI